MSYITIFPTPSCTIKENNFNCLLSFKSFRVSSLCYNISGLGQYIQIPYYYLYFQMLTLITRDANIQYKNIHKLKKST